VQLGDEEVELHDGVKFVVVSSLQFHQILTLLQSREIPKQSMGL
jgi:hypothetical protein